MDFQEAIEKRTKWYEDNYSLPETAAGGNAFEDLCKFYVENGPWGKVSGAAVWKWKDPGNPLRLNAASEKDRSSKDTGCDLVAQTPDGGYYVIQCKYYPESQLTLDYAHLANVAALAERYSVPQKHVIFCYVAKSVSSQAESVLSHYTCFREDDFENPDFDWAPMFGGERKPKKLRDYQKEAIEACIEGFKAEEEEGKPQVGKLIMACGTGKTFTALGLAKRLSKGEPYTVLFLAPSIALVSQSFQSWALEEDISSLIVCSDSTAGTQKGMDEEEEMDETIADIASPDVTTNSEEMREKWEKIKGQGRVLRVVFSTYQSLEAVHEFQEKSGVKFDLTICDEAHRTASREEAKFAKAAEPGYINTVKKLFMTATPKIYSDTVKAKAEDEYATVLYSMDDETKYGPEFYRFGFGEAVDKEVLCDYRVLILAMKKSAPELEDLKKLVTSTDVAKDKMAELKREISRARSERTRALAQKNMLEFEKKLATLAGKIQGAYIDLSDLEASIQGEVAKDFDGKVVLKTVEGKGDFEDREGSHFAHSAIGFANSIRNSKIITQALSSEAFPGKDPKIFSRHIDGKMSSDRRLEDLIWLKQGQKQDEIRLVTNAQCLSEGVDVPNLDAVVFFEKRQSQIGIIQAVGRVMRQAEGKKYGYIILPIMLSDNETPESMLEDSDEYAAIWQVLQSMRSVDERLDAVINTLALSRKAEKKKNKGKKKQEGVEELDQPQKQRSLFDEEMQKALVSFVLSKCGSSMYWDDWVSNISGSVQNMINEIDELADTPEIKPKFEAFVENLSKTLHKEQSKEDAVNLIAQFIVTRPVFSILFPASDFDSNPISRALEGIADDFKGAYSAYDKELGELKFSMEQAAKAVAKDPGARKRLVKNFYEKFYQKVFPKEADANGVVYTPEPVVDFMIKQTDRLLQRNFGKKLQDEGIEILDPFSGTGTFVTRLLDKDLGVIDDEHIGKKYEKEIWANEIMPTAYYISTLNIEDAMKQRTGEAKSFPGAVLTDTFRISEAKGMLDVSLFSKNSDRENEEEDKKIWAIISNPPYSANQGNANENNAHARYDVLDKRIFSTYKALQDSTNTQALNDSYVRAFRWASDRLQGKGIVSFITNGGWLRNNTGMGLRRSFAEEFNDIYVYDLRGNARLHNSKEGGSVFDIQTPVAITFLVKNPDSGHKGQIHYVSTPDFASKEEKLSLLEEAKGKEPEWGKLTMDEFGDWFDQRDTSFYSFLPMGIAKNKDKADSGIFSLWSNGITTARDFWVYSFSKEDLLQNVETFEDFFNQELERWKEWRAEGGRSKAEDVAPHVVEQDPTRIKWNREIYQLLDRTSAPLKVENSYIYTALYRPFVKKYLYLYKPLLNDTSQQLSLFPKADSRNFEINVAGIGSHSFSCLMSNSIPDLHVLESRTQSFPLHRYQETRFGAEGYEKRNAITDQALKMFREVYKDDLNSDPDKDKEQIFFYIYGLLHSKEYREKYQDTLSKDLPRIPFSSHFREFEKAGRELAAFHVGYETAPKYEGLAQVGEPVGEINTMKLDKDKGVLTVNGHLSFKDIPKEAFEYVVNGRSPLEWVVDQYKVKTDKDSGIVSNPNDSPISDIDYVSDLIPRLVMVSLKTQEIVNSLSRIDRLTSMDSEIERIWGTK